jgi:DNA invertase Pin-like site-specific DNA recombinase
MKIAIYARVSTEDKGQDTDNQIVQLREYCARQGWTVYEEYIDHVSGKTATRDAFKRMFLDGSRRRFDIVLAWALDRFTREGVLETFEHLKKLTAYGVQFESFTEPHFRTTGPVGELMIAIAAWIAKQERVRMSERTKAGLERVRRAGTVLGRPKLVTNIDWLLEKRRAGCSIRDIAQSLSISKTSAARLLARATASLQPAQSPPQTP